MRGTILLNADENTNRVEEEEKLRFTKEVLDNMGIPMKSVWGEENGLSVDGKIKLRSILSSYSVTVIDNIEGALQIYHDKELIAEWRKPSYVLKRDFNQIDPRKHLYLEMYIDYTSIFETENQ